MVIESSSTRQSLNNFKIEIRKTIQDMLADISENRGRLDALEARIKKIDSLESMLYGDPSDAEKIGLRAIVEKITNQIKDTENRRNSDRNREEHDMQAVLNELSAIKESQAENKGKTKGISSTLTQIGLIVTVLFSAVSGIVEVAKLIWHK